MRILLGLLMLSAVLHGGEAQAGRKIYFTAPAFRDCHISLYNTSGLTQTVTLAAAGGDGSGTAWTETYARTDGIAGTDKTDPGLPGGLNPVPCSSLATAHLPACSVFQISPGALVQVGYTKVLDLPGSFGGSISLAEDKGQMMAAGFCKSDKKSITFSIAGGLPF